MVRPENSSGGLTWRQLMIPRRFSSVRGAAFASLIAPILLVTQGPPNAFAIFSERVVH
jgi:hypothetical protein